MMRVLAFCLLSGLAFAAMPGTMLRADDLSTDTLHVALGEDGLALGGRLHGGAVTSYVLAGEAGQTLTISLTATKPGVHFDVVASGGEMLQHIRASAGDSRNLTLPVGGEYRISVYLRESAAQRNERADYRLTIRGDAPAPGD